MAEMIAPFLIEQADFAVAGADADPDAATGGERRRAGTKNFDVWLRARLVAPKRGFVGNDGSVRPRIVRYEPACTAMTTLSLSRTSSDVMPRICCRRIGLASRVALDVDLLAIGKSRLELLG
jgi:hypothetical protein